MSGVCQSSAFAFATASLAFARNRPFVSTAIVTGTRSFSQVRASVAPSEVTAGKPIVKSSFISAGTGLTLTRSASFSATWSGPPVDTVLKMMVHSVLPGIV